jgi:signal transduction histidine kinase
MNKLFNSFFAKITGIFLLLLLLLVLVQIWLSVNSSKRYVQETEQKLNRDLATHIATEFEPFLKDTIKYDDIEELIHYLMVLNPRVEFYLLNEQGQILSYFAIPKEKVELSFVNLDPINDYLKNENKLVLGDDPRNVGKQKPFSATPITLAQNKPGYLYVILGGELYDSAADMLRESYIIKGFSVGLALVFIVAGIVGIVLFALLTKRLYRMADVVERFQHGDYNARIKDKSKDEIGQLGNTFNDMADKIVKNMQELKRTDDLRRELVANVSHDLRTPLSSIQGYLETIFIKEESISPDERKKYLDIIFSNTKLLNNLVQELFELSKLDAKQIEPKIEPFSMADLTMDVVLKFKPLAEKLGVKIDAKAPQDLPLVTADIGLIERALSNLTDNAIRNTPENGQVTVDLLPKKNTVYITISDTGKGIAAEDLPLIFERFKRIDKTQSRSYGGAGLGLAIAKKILEVHNSNINVESKVNTGTQFSFALPTG